MAEVTVRCLQGAQIETVLDALADLRITVFRDWPYLYDGDRAYEQRYLAAFAASKRALVVGAFAGERLVGAATALPLADEHAAMRAPFEARGDDVARLFYLAESVLLPDWRGRGLGHRFFDERERAARAGGFEEAVFCAVVRDPNDPRRPRDERALAPFWRKRGYLPARGVTCRFAWRDVGETWESEKTLQFWRRRL
jgi:GNAT superfamily N-acetyltransferase